MIGVIDYGMGNLLSVSKALERLELDYIVSGDQAVLEKAQGLILPGVGSFRDAMKMLERDGLARFIRKWASEGKPLLGICLGMQLLFEESEENGLTCGLALLPGRVSRLSGEAADGTAYKVPHMGWNKLRFMDPSHVLLQSVEEGYAYFVHSYYVQQAHRDHLLAVSLYSEVIPAVVGQGNVLGTQFHPEKSGTVGMAILKNFGRMVREGVVQRG